MKARRNDTIDVETGMLTLDQIIKALLASERTHGYREPDEQVLGSDARYEFSSARDAEAWVSVEEAEKWGDTCQNREHKDRVYVYFPSDDPYCGKQYCCQCLVENFNQ